ncbi:sporulation membrane protein YtaF [Acetanaerobacterium elongatum]|uniref:Putative sporulation protein YtaF n=1 Tax=Acetanaerobacterium elongatum TaxID=258515 RepID=A0A1H0H2Z5_9FIRM|nr:sporulation membrane protein YtaF [Acetanaerobacterium elongatum]SDO13517.1 putative sporulation protein YtaF [Acetanaerobacterium elongatum]
MHILSVILLSAAANLDNLSIGLAYGIRKVRIPFLSNLIVSMLSGVFTLITCFVGKSLSGVLPNSFGNILGGGIVCVMGIWSIAEYLIKLKQSAPENITARKPSSEYVDKEFIEIMQHPDKADMDYSGDISAKESLLLGTALALNCLATGLGAGMTGINVIAITVLTIILSFITITLGTLIGKKCASLITGDKASILSGALFIVIGLYEILF